MFVALASLASGQALEEAKRAFDKGDFAAAARLFEAAQQTSPGCDILFYLGLARYRLQQSDAAIIAFQSAVQCDPKLVPAHLALGEAYAERGNDNEALASFMRVLSLDARNASALHDAAAIYLKNQANDKAIPLLEALVARNADAAKGGTGNAATNGAAQAAAGSRPAAGSAQTGAALLDDSRVDLAAAYVATGNRDRAEAQYQAVLRRQPNHPGALLGLASLYLKKGDDEPAIALLRRAATAAPNAFEPRYLLGSAFNRLGRYQEALTELQSAVRLGGDESEVYYHLARAFGGLGRQDERAKALEHFAELSRKATENTDAQRRALKLMDEARLLVDGGDLAGAAARLEEARELRPSDDRLLFRLASVNYDLSRNDPARSYAQEALSLAPSEWLYHYLMGLIEKRAGRWPQARSSLETALRLNPRAAEVHNALGEVALRQGDRQRAIASFQRAVELAPAEQAYGLNLEAARR